MTESISRQPQGIPVGGQFSTTTHAEPGVFLAPQEPERPEETQRARRGRDFYPSADEMAKWPALYATEGVALGDKPIVAHYFQGGMDWYITEYDPKAKEAFGYADLGVGHGEWGYIQLDVENLRGQFGLPIERDLDFVPGTAANACIGKYKAEKAAAEAAEALAAKQADDHVDFGWDGPDDPDPLSPDDRKKWDEHHRFAYNYGSSDRVLGTTGFEDLDRVEAFAGFAATAYQESGWDGMKDIRTIVDDWLAKQRTDGDV